jgi:hypothetical protein
VEVGSKISKQDPELPHQIQNPSTPQSFNLKIRFFFFINESKITQAHPIKSIADCKLIRRYTK